MKENDFNMTQTDADFDARCHALLAEKKVAAPPPGDGLFAQPFPAWKRWGMTVGAALLLAVAAAWMSNIGEEAASAPDEVQTSETMELREVLDVSDNAASTEPVTGNEVAVEEASMPTIENVEAPEDIVPTAAPNVVREAPSASTAFEEPTLTQGGSNIETASAEEARPDGPIATSDAEAATTAPQSVPDPVVLPAESVAQPSSEEAKEEAVPEESKPRLTLPLTLPAGGGQH